MAAEQSGSELHGSHLDGQLRKLREAGGGSDLRRWGHRACKLSRRAHLRVWYERLGDEPVSQLRDLLRELAGELEGIDGCEVFARNLRIRADSLQSYLDGGSPFIPPDAGPEERELQQAMARAKEVLDKTPSRCGEVLRTQAACGQVRMARSFQPGPHPLPNPGNS